MDTQEPFGLWVVWDFYPLKPLPSQYMRTGTAVRHFFGAHAVSSLVVIWMLSH